jgi:hypothetical protein
MLGKMVLIDFIPSVFFSLSSISRFGVYELANACDALSVHIQKGSQVLHSHVMEPRY